jgi:hypothetical protein
MKSLLSTYLMLYEQPTCFINNLAMIIMRDFDSNSIELTAGCAYYRTY